MKRSIESTSKTLKQHCLKINFINILMAETNSSAKEGDNKKTNTQTEETTTVLNEGFHSAMSQLHGIYIIRH